MATATNAVSQVLRDVEDKMKKAVGVVSRQFTEVRGGRANPALLDQLTVTYYGTSTPLKQLAAVTAPEPRMLVIQPWDANMLQDIEKAVLQSGLGITPVKDSKILRLPLPALTLERRNELVKLLHKMAEEGRVTIRTVRRDANESMKKLKTDKLISEDDSFKAQEQVQKLTDKYIAEIDALLKAKEQELLTA